MRGAQSPFGLFGPTIYPFIPILQINVPYLRLKKQQLIPLAVFQYFFPYIQLKKNLSHN